jgi:uncharacterized membrane protein
MLKDLLILLPIFLGIDFVWLGFIAKGFYDKQFSAFARTLNWPAAILVYLLIPLGIAFFVLPKASGDRALALLWGAFYGLVVYGVYDLTNYATLKDWSLTTVLVDILWGIFICGAASYLTVYLSGKI